MTKGNNSTQAGRFWTPLRASINDLALCYNLTPSADKRSAIGASRTGIGVPNSELFASQCFREQAADPPDNDLMRGTLVLMIR